jgi:Carboxypeptidase regulatory-like domain
MLTQLFFRGQVLVVVESVSGTISGTVTDPSGAAIAGTAVKVKNNLTQVVRTVTTNAQGRFTVPGFQNTVQANVPVVVGGGRNLPLKGRNYTQLVESAGFYGTGEDYSVGGAMPQLPSVYVASDRFSGRDLIGVA